MTGARWQAGDILTTKDRAVKVRITKVGSSSYEFVYVVDGGAPVAEKCPYPYSVPHHHLHKKFWERVNGRNPFASVRRVLDL